MKELWGRGFNAHGQLNTSTLASRTDIKEFKKIISATRELKIVWAGWSQTVGMFELTWRTFIEHHNNAVLRRSDRET